MVFGPAGDDVQIGRLLSRREAVALLAGGVLAAVREGSEPQIWVRCG